MQCPINRNGVSLANLHLESPPELHCGRGHGEHSVGMGWCSIRVAKHDGNAVQKSKPECFHDVNWPYISCAFLTDAICKYTKMKGLCFLCLFGLHCCKGLCVLYMIHCHLHNWAMHFRWSNLCTKRPKSHREHTTCECENNTATIVI